MTSDKTLGMWYSSRVDVDGGEIHPWMDTSTYQHRDVGYDQPSQHNRAQDMQQRFITPGQHPHVSDIVSSFVWSGHTLF